MANQIELKVTRLPGEEVQLRVLALDDSYARALEEEAGSVITDLNQVIEGQAGADIELLAHAAVLISTLAEVLESELDVELDTSELDGLGGGGSW